jgi:predicted enzyme related to lactoylglutathione lyase
MRLLTCLVTTLVSLTSFGALTTASAAGPHAPQPDGVRAFDGVWIYVADITEGRPVEEHGPPMSMKITFRVEDDAVVMVRPRGDERIALDGSITEVPREGAIARYRGAWKDGVLEYDIETERLSDNEIVSVLKREFRVTPDGMQVRVVFGDPPRMDSLALYRHPEDIALPEPLEATIDDLAWLAGAWDGIRGKSSIEEHWSPPRGGAMLGVSRTVRRETDQMRAFEYLRIVERDGGLVYVAQPNGRSATEYVLTELGPTRAVFDNPRHDFPQRITYERSAEGDLTASIGFVNGGRPRQFEFEREGRLVHHVEIVSGDVDAKCAALERVHGLSFGPALAELGGARVAEAPDGSRIGVRAPLAAHEQPIIRTYLAVDDIAQAIAEAEAAGAMVAYPPTEHGDSGTYAIYILAGVQVGLWQQ